MKHSQQEYDEKAARTIYYDSILYIEATPPVIARVGPTAGVNRMKIVQILRRVLDTHTASIYADDIMCEIADAAPPIDGDLGG